MPLERASQEEQNGTNFSFIALSSEELCMSTHTHHTTHLVRSSLQLVGSQAHPVSIEEVSQGKQCIAELLVGLCLIGCLGGGGGGGGGWDELLHLPTHLHYHEPQVAQDTAAAGADRTYNYIHVP